MKLTFRVLELLLFWKIDSLFYKIQKKSLEKRTKESNDQTNLDNCRRHLFWTQLFFFSNVYERRRLISNVFKKKINK